MRLGEGAGGDLQALVCGAAEESRSALDGKLPVGAAALDRFAELPLTGTLDREAELEFDTGDSKLAGDTAG
jgi:hypothetical protein